MDLVDEVGEVEKIGIFQQPIRDELTSRSRQRICNAHSDWLSDGELLTIFGEDEHRGVY